ncbi:uncharacterized protein LOC119574510 [Penaeus monodon]|uniref:uncharacterized protein LOC119574510 n=1 Tax=Penaeus monodon TaxID=6687 RepID=UPI0018A75040|nr:uncharacterized protein LOC119574510 [Penaeus monodon]
MVGCRNEFACGLLAVNINLKKVFDLVHQKSLWEILKFSETDPRPPTKALETRAVWIHSWQIHNRPYTNVIVSCLQPASLSRRLTPVHRESLWENTRPRGIPTWIIGLTASLYTGTESTAKCGGGMCWMSCIFHVFSSNATLVTGTPSNGMKY